MSQTIRRVEETDYAALTRLQDAVWFPLRSENSWHWLINQNPDQGDYPGGYVYQSPDTGEILGFIGVTRLGFKRAGEDLFANTGHTMIALPDATGAGFRLAATMIRKTEGFAAFTLNNNAMAARVHSALRAKPIHETTSNQSASWITNRMQFYRAGIGRRIHSATKYKLARLTGERMNKWRDLPEDFSTQPNVQRVKDPMKKDDAREEFAHRLAAEDFITVRRDHTRLSWRLSDPELKAPHLMWSFDRGNGVEGWLIAMITKESEISAPALTIVDLISLSASTNDVLPSLVRTAIDAARAMRMTRLNLPHFSPETERALNPLLESARIRTSHMHSYVKAIDLSHDELEKSWRHTPWDGDYFFALRQPPIR
ncbi:MAG: hypothetical protein CME88_10345 [Hirschia sp.]|nr:hypothetical protein [Hirschia sp.]MBF18766.1 hypothetical protein [Hirschia sp.]